ncbi:DEAD/DEAH box helicase [Paenibacillus bovis]|uniref:DEAD/DEAH box helicase n=1 Tax=Paenibacillus bovis TaxID=1616788 RepID=A0A172ZKM5_9BACL|nr:DEAD/DEAH box helicase [Paenibacillus bovis]ANF98148.1 DEAD/DEAH box helicase [Paenibacillus bovis]
MESKLNFLELGMEEVFNDALTRYGITTPSPVQEETIPLMLAGRDIIAQSQTGSGKTLAYLLPILQKIDPQRKQMQALILAPTQELAMQIVRESERYGEECGITTLGLIGGAAIKRQVEKLKRHPHIAVGTPGRINELINMRKLKMHEVNTIVVDEVDQVLGLGGGADVQRIIKSARRDRQLVFLSATVNDQIRSVAQRDMQDPAVVGIEPERHTASAIEHVYFVTEERNKVDTLRRVLRHYKAPRSIVFVNTTELIAEIESKLDYMGFKVRAIYGDADKVTRSTVLSQFRSGKVEVLVATDVAARGLDIEDLNLVVSLDPAFDAEFYVHRSGRTGRMGKKGVAASIVTDRERFIMRKFAETLNIDLQEQVLESGHVISTDEVKRPVRKPAASRPAKTAPAGQPNEAVEQTSVQPVRTTPSENKAKPSTGGKPAAGRNGAVSKKEGRTKTRKADQKSKGAPKWLKAKREASQDEK